LKLLYKDLIVSQIRLLKLKNSYLKKDFLIMKKVKFFHY
jgi:hypothetical protein